MNISTRIEQRSRGRIHPCIRRRTAHPIGSAETSRTSEEGSGAALLVRVAEPAGVLFVGLCGKVIADVLLFVFTDTFI